MEVTNSDRQTTEWNVEMTCRFVNHWELTKPPK
jgi:hypothetical protein